MDERGMEVQGPKVGAVLEGATLILTCDIIGGMYLGAVHKLRGPIFDLF